MPRALPGFHDERGPVVENFGNDAVVALDDEGRAATTVQGVSRAVRSVVDATGAARLSGLADVVTGGDCDSGIGDAAGSGADGLHVARAKPTVAVRGTTAGGRRTLIASVSFRGVGAPTLTLGPG